MNQQKVWHELENKEFQKLKLSKNVNKKKYCSKWNGNLFQKGPDHLPHSLGKVIWSFWPNNLISFEPLLRELHNQTDGTYCAFNSISNSQNSPERNSWAILWMVGGQTTPSRESIFSFSSIITQTFLCWQDTKNNYKIFFFFWTYVQRTSFIRWGLNQENQDLQKVKK